MGTIILAGGLSTRMGRDKSLIEINGVPVLESLISGFAEALPPVVVVLRPGQTPIPEDALHTFDVFPGAGPMAGLHAGLIAAPDDCNLVVACDMPFAVPSLGRYLLSLLDDHDAVVPVVDGRPEPLYAAYRKTCLPEVERSLKAGELRMKDLLGRLNTLYVGDEDLRRYDPDLRSFLNINTPEDYDRALELAREATTSP